LDFSFKVDDLEVELNEVMRKYKAAVAQLSVDQITLQDQTAQLMTLEQEKASLKEQVYADVYFKNDSLLYLPNQLILRWLN